MILEGEIEVYVFASFLMMSKSVLRDYQLEKPSEGLTARKGRDAINNTGRSLRIASRLARHCGRLPTLAW